MSSCRSTGRMESSYVISLCLHVGLRSFVIGKFTPQWLLQHIHWCMISLCLHVPQKLKPNILNYENSKQCYILCLLVWVAQAGVWSIYWDNLSIMRVEEWRLNNLVSVGYFIQGKATYAWPVEIGSQSMLTWHKYNGGALMGWLVSASEHCKRMEWRYW